MKPRINSAQSAPGAYHAMLGLQHYVDACGLDHRLLELVKMRASQINGCAYCLDMHSKDARALGETEQRLYALNAWRETPFFTDRERAALEWAEAVTLVHEGHVPDAVYEAVRPHFTEAELVDLTMALVAINGWNRLSIAFRPEVGNYRSPHAKPPAAATA
jgi:AhpD family alkylhydroperoxidase